MPSAFCRDCAISVPSGKRGAVVPVENSRGRPDDTAELMLGFSLAAAYFKVVGECPAETADHRNPGPFVRLVCGVLDRLGAGSVNAAELVNRVGRLRRGSRERRVRELTLKA